MSFRIGSIALTALAVTSLTLLPLAAQGGGRGGGRGGAGGFGGFGGAGQAAQMPRDTNPMFGVTPTFPTNDPIIKRIYAMGMDTSWTRKLAHAFLDSIGPRLTGSPEFRRAQNWAVNTYKNWGIDAKVENFGTWRSWRRGYSHIDLISPRVRSLDGTMLASSPGTGKRDIDAEVVVLPRLADSLAFRAWLPSVKGKLVMISAAQPSCRLPADIRTLGTQYTDSALAADRSKASSDMSARIRATGRSAGLGGGALGMTLDSAGAAGIITSRPKQTAGVAMEIFDTWNERSPAIALTCEDYGLVWRLAESGSKPVIRMNLDAENLGEQPLGNVIATIKGTEKPNEVVMLSAHFDSWDGASGATDNGTGTLMMMEAMRILKQAYPNPKRTIMVGHWAGEEQGLVGSAAWAEDHPEINARIQALFNQDDGTGRRTSVGGAGFLSADKLVPGWIARLPSNMRSNFRYSGMGSPSRGGGGGSTDSQAFACHVVPTFDLFGSSWDYFNLTWHTDIDTYDKVVFDDLSWNATLVALLAYMAADDPQFMTRNTLAQNDSIWKSAGSGRGGMGGRGGAAQAANAVPGTVAPCPTAVRKTNPRY